MSSASFTQQLATGQLARTDLVRQDHLSDMLDRMTRGPYRSTPRCVAINRSRRDSLSFPLFFDPNFFSCFLRIEG